MGSVSTWLFNRSFYIDIFSAEALSYAALLSDALDLVETLELDDDTLPPETVNAFVQAIRAVITPTYIRDEMARNINALFDYFEDFSRGLALTLDLRPIKRSLSSDQQISAFADVLAQVLPPCTPAEPPADSLLPTCRLPDQSLEELTAQVRERLPRFIRNLPDLQPIGDPIPPNTQSGTLLGGAVQALVNFGAMLLIGALLVGLFAAFLLVGSTKDLWAALGIMLVGAALPVVLLGVAIVTGRGSDVISVQIGSVLSDQIGLQSSQALSAASLSAVQSAETQIGNGFLLYGGGAAVVGVVLVLVSMIIPLLSKRKDDFASSDMIGPLR
ncbi:MAG: hypothetical protein ACK4P1_09650 [Aggregatilineales bacterium]